MINLGRTRRHAGRAGAVERAKKALVLRGKTKRVVAQCEWCDAPASRRVTARVRDGQYRRYSCPKHHDKLDTLVLIDIGPLVRRESMTNPTGFNAVTGRMLSASPPSSEDKP